MKKSLMVIFSLLFFCVLHGGDFTLFRDGKAQVSLVLPEKVSPQLLAPVRYFNRELAKSTGSQLPEVKTVPASGQVIVFNPVKSSYIGRSKYTMDFPDHRTLRITGTPLAIRYAL
ncbi:MAG: hypothetical protein IKO93_02835, partial [Lentisphaeria bacterium]|nr:hypothetical protein [Lentisphaeria bacterium]